MFSRGLTGLCVGFAHLTLTFSVAFLEFVMILWFRLILSLLLVCSMSLRPVLRDPEVPSQGEPSESSGREDEHESVGRAPRKQINFFLENEKQ